MAYINDAVYHVGSRVTDGRVHHVQPVEGQLGTLVDTDWVCVTCGWQASEPDALYNKAKAEFEEETWR